MRYREQIASSKMSSATGDGELAQAKKEIEEEEHYDDDEFEQATIGSKPSEPAPFAPIAAEIQVTGSHELAGGYVPTQLVPIAEDEDVIPENSPANATDAGMHDSTLMGDEEAGAGLGDQIGGFDANDEFNASPGGFTG